MKMKKRVFSAGGVKPNSLFPSLSAQVLIGKASRERGRRDTL
jgi:hypothetical protein